MRRTAGGVGGGDRAGRGHGGVGEPRQNTPLATGRGITLRNSRDWDRPGWVPMAELLAQKCTSLAWSGRQEGQSCPAGGGDALGVTDAARRTRCFCPASVVELLRDQELAAACDHRFDGCRRLAPGEGQQCQRGVEGLGRRGGIRPPAAVLGLAAREDLERPSRLTGGGWRAAAAKASRLTEASVTLWSLRFSARRRHDRWRRGSGRGRRRRGFRGRRAWPAAGHKSPVSRWRPLLRAARSRRRPGRVPAARRPSRGLCGP